MSDEPTSTPVTDVFRLKLSKNLLLSMGDTERDLVLLLGHAANDLATLNRLLLFSISHPWPHEIADKIAGGRAGMIMRILAGKIWESYELINKRILSSRAGSAYLEHMDEVGKDCFERLRKHRGDETGAILSKLRNQHAFHFPRNSADIIASALAEIPDDEPLEFFISANGDANYFHASETVFSLASTHTVTGGDVALRMGKVADAIVGSAGDLMQFFGYYIAAVLEQTTNVMAQQLTPEWVPATEGDPVVVPPITVNLGKLTHTG